MPEYKLYYFEARGLAEPCRWIFAHAGADYEDIRFPMGSVTAEKKEELGLQWGQLPVLEVDGKKIAQSVTMTRYLAKKFNLTGKDEWEAIKCDEMIDGFRDFVTKWGAMWTESDETKKEAILKNLVEVEAPNHLGKIEKILNANGKSPWLVGSGLTWADIYVAHFISQFGLVFEKELVKGKGLPALENLVEKVQNTAGIKEWIEKRPKTKF